MLNHITIMGRLTRDPELRRTGSGVAVASFTLAVDRDYVAEGQERETDFIDVVAWRSTGEFVSKYFTKGRMAVVSGRLQIRNWNDKDGNKRRSAEVIADNVYFGDSKKEDAGTQGAAQNNYAEDPQNIVPQGNYAAPQGTYGAPQGNYGAPQGAYGAPQGNYNYGGGNDFAPLDNGNYQDPF